MNIEKRRELRAKGKQLEKAIDGMIAERRVRQTDLVEATGKSKTLISFICNPGHKATWSIRDLPALLHLLDDKSLLRMICSWRASVPAELPTNSQALVGCVIKAIANLQLLVGEALDDGKITKDEEAAIRGRLLDLVRGAL